MSFFYFKSETVTETDDDDDDDSVNNDKKKLVGGEKEQSTNRNGQRKTMIAGRILESIWRQQTLLGIVLTIALAIMLWFTWKSCKLCVVASFVVSSLLCMRCGSLAFVFWPSLLILIIHTHAIRETSIKFDVPIGKMADNLLQPSNNVVLPSRRLQQQALLHRHWLNVTERS